MGVTLLGSVRLFLARVTLVTSVLSLALVAGCQRPADREAAVLIGGPHPETPRGSESAPAEEAVPVTHVAPVFAHGRGRAPMGPGSPPTAFLSEEDGVGFIREALTEASVPTGFAQPSVGELLMPVMTADDLVGLIPPQYLAEAGDDPVATQAFVDEVQLLLHAGLLGEQAALDGSPASISELVAAELLPEGRPDADQTTPWRSRVREARYPGGTWPSLTVRVVLDAADAAGGVAFEFVSQTDWIEWKPEAMEETDEDWTMALYDTALSLRTALVVKQPGGIYAVFYDPCIAMEESASGDLLGPEAQTARARALELLGAQVDEFIAWYHALDTASRAGKDIL